MVNDKNTSNKSSGLTALLNKDFSFGSAFPDKLKGLFYSEMSLLTNSGVNISRSLGIIISQTTNNRQKYVIENVYKDLIDGKSFSEAIKNSTCFSLYEYYTICIGEESGSLQYVFQKLSLYYKRKMKHRHQIISALSYPVMVLGVSIIVISFMMSVVVPMFTEILNNSNNSLPQITKSVISISHFISNNFGLISSVAILLVLFFWFCRKVDIFRRISSAIYLNIPILSSFILKATMARFCETMSLLVSSKVPLVRAIELVSNIINLYPFEIALKGINKKVFDGQSLYSAMSQYQIFDAKLVALVEAGEEINGLGGIFEELAQQYNQDVEFTINGLNSILEPLLILFVGIIVGLILIAMYLPMFQISTSII